MDQLLETLFKCILNPQFLSQGSEVLKEWEKNPGYAPALAKILLGNQLPVEVTEALRFQVRQFAGILIKNFISDYWNESSHMTPADVMETRHLLLDCIKIDESKLKNLAALGLGGIVLRDFPVRWPTCFDEILYLTHNYDRNSIDSVLVALTIIFDECDDRLSRACFTLFPAIFKFFQYADDTNDIRLKEKSLNVASKCLESLSWADGVDNELVNFSLNSSWLSWFNLLIAVISTDDSSVEMKRLAVKMLTSFYRDFTVYSLPYYYAVIQPSWVLLHTTVPLYQEKVVYAKEFGSIDENDTEIGGVEGLVIQLLELITSLLIRPVMGNEVVNELKSLINTLTWYLPLTLDQEEMWTDDPNQFIVDEDIEEYLKSPRLSCLKLISVLVDMFTDSTVEAIVRVVESMLSNISQGLSAPLLQSSNPEIQLLNDGYNRSILEVVRKNPVKHMWKTREAAVLLLGNISQDIISFNARIKKTGRQQLDVAKFFSSIVLTDLAQTQQTAGSEFLKGRALWCTAKLSDIMDANHPDCINIFRICCNALSENEPLAVRLSSCYAVLKITKKAVSTQEINDILPALLANLVSLIQVSSTDNLHLVLDTLLEVSIINSELSSIVPSYAATVFLKLFSKYYGEGSLNTKIIAVIRFWCDLKSSLSYLLDAFLPFVCGLLNAYPSNPKEKSASFSSTSTMGSQMESLLILPNSLEIMTMFLKKSNSGSKERDRLMDLFEPLLELLDRTEDISILLQGTTCLRAFCGYAADEILKRAIEEKVVETAVSLLNPLKNEAGALSLGYLIVQIFCKISPKVDEDLLIGCLNKLHRTKMPSIVQGLVLVFARLIHSHSHEILSFLANLTIERRSAIKVLLDKWLIHQPLIRGRYTKNATITALARIYTLKDQHIESLLVVGYNPSHSNVGSEVLAPFKILCTLIRCLENEAFMPKRKQQEALGVNEEFQTIVEGSGIGYVGDYEEPGDRMDTIEDDRDSVISDHEDPMESLKSDLMKEVREDYDVRDFQIPVSKDKGLGDYETGSECLMSDMLDFDYEENDDINDDINEDDMYGLGDWYGGITLQSFLLDFFKNLITNDKDYLLSCMKHLQPEDTALFKKHFTF